MFELKNRKKLALAASIYFSLILAVILIGQHEKLSEIFKSFFSVISPLTIGFTVAYLLNPILIFFEKKIFNKLKIGVDNFSLLGTPSIILFANVKID